MATDVFTGATSAAGTGQLSNQVLTAYSKSAMFALRDDMLFEQFAKEKPGDLTNPGTPVTFTFWSDIAVTTTPLSEVVDVDAVGLSDSQVTVTPAEYGKAVLKTIRIMVDDFLVGWDADVANLINQNMVETIDVLAREALDGSTNITTIDAGAESSLTALDKITAASIRRRAKTLKKANAVPWFGDKYACVIAPDVAYDLQSETGEAGWLLPAAYVDTARIYNGELGTWAGFKFVETNRGRLNVDGGSTTVDTYYTYFLGQECLAKATSIPPHIVLGPVTDKLRRFQPLGWHTYIGFDTLRQASVQILITASSIGTN